ncbi:hypothetical protein ILUMI_24658 [Ignelater luminosus]|uniref:NACHT domain-containing protein n=1 Tax=Ignelater luminosus TaxID=2038154 RepID=A0A8K0C8R9_IGNLU|nr:hypothetical protein ILUMI_24658 [Ignelater luminosus]
MKGEFQRHNMEEAAAMVKDITKNSNREYGLKIATLFSLHCVFQENYDEKFWITFNVDGVVPFGNIILYQGGMMYILRIKYEDDPKDIKEKEFLAPTGDFSLIKSFYDNVNLDMNLKSEKFKSNEIENIKILFFTNGNIISDKAFIWKEAEEENIPDFLKLDLFKFKTSDRIKIYENDFYLCNESISMEQIDLEIKRLIQNIIKNNEIETDKVTMQFLNFLKENCTNECLTKQNIFDTVTEILLNDYIYGINFEEEEKFDFNLNGMNLWKNIIKDKKITIIENCDQDVLKFLLNYINLEIKNSCSDIPKCKLEIYNNLWKNKKLPLLLEINNSQDLLHIQQILSLSNYSYNAIILSPELTLSKNDASNTIFKTLSDLNEEDKKEILNLPITFQGRLSVLLRDLVNENMFKFIKCSDIIKVLLGTLNVGNELKFLTENLIKRSTTKIFIEMDVLDEVKDQCILIEDSQNCLNNIKNKNKNIFISNKNIDFKQEIENHKSYSAIHYLSVYDDRYLEWKDSYGCIEKIKKFQINLQSETDILDHLSRRITLISGTPGMGKSTLIDYVANKANINKLILKINLNEHQSYFENINNLNKNAVEHVRYFINMHNYRNVQLIQAIYENFIAKRDLILLLDGFDEISVCYKEEVTKFAKCLYDEDFSIWITTRPVMKSYLEEKFRTFCVDLNPFTINDKKEYLINYYANSIIMDVNTFVDGLLDLCKKHLNDDLTSVPLYTKLVAEAFLNDYEHSSGGLTKSAINFNLLYLYKNFIENKMNVLCAKCGNDDKIREHQSLFALKLLFPLHHHLVDIDKELDYYRSDPHKIQFLQREGVITINEKLEINFIHRTFAEYLAADWLSRNIHEENAKILIKERFSEDYKFLFSIFDLLLAEKCPLHLAIINKNFHEIKKYLNLYSIDTIDKGGRSVLHMLCLYSVQFPLMYHKYANFHPTSESTRFLNSKLYQEDGMLNIIEQIPDYKILDIKKDILGYNPLDYALANNSLAVAEKIYEKLKPSTINVNIKLELKKSYLGYCAVLNYKSLFNLLLPYFASRDFLLKNVDGNVNVNTYFKNMYSCNGRISNYKIDFETMTILDLLQSKSAYSGYINGRYTDLRYAIIFDSKDNVEKLLREGADIDKWDHDNNTPLHYAALHGCLENAKLLLSKGANVNKRNYADDTALHLALRENHIEIARILLVNDANGNVANKKGESSLHYAIQKNYLDIFKIIVNKNGINDNQNIDGNTPFHLALKKGQLSIAEILLFNGSDGNLQNKMGETPLHYAIENGYDEIAQGIILKGFVNNKKNIFGNTPLHLALIKCNSKIAKSLIFNGADVNVENNENEIALHLAAQNGLNDVIEIIISNSDINRKNDRGNTPLHLALMKRYLASAEMLISNGADINLENNENETALHYAVQCGHRELVSNLLTKDLIDKKDNRGNTPLHLASAKNKTDTVELLISHGANLNIVNNARETALRHCITNENIVDLFISHGADVNIPNYCNDTILHILIRNGHNKIAEKVLLSGAVNNIQDKKGNTPLHLALIKKYPKVAELLISNGADVNIINKEKETALHCAARSGCYDIIDKILSNHLIVDKQNCNGETALQLALEEGHIDIVEELLSNGANVMLEDVCGDTSFAYALSDLNNEEIVNKMVLNLKADNIINKCSQDDENSLLHLALSKRYTKAIERLIDCGADINKTNKLCETPLYLAIKHDCLNFVPKLISKENINIRQRKNGNTALHMALLKNNKDVINLLIKSGADVNIGNKNGQSVFHLAVKRGDLDMVTQMLENCKVEINKPNKKGDTVLHLATQKGREDIVNVLLSHEIDIALRNHWNQTALDLAEEIGNMKIVLMIENYMENNV